MRCPFLYENELCSIYPYRFSCCRNFPNRNPGMYCENTVCVYDSQDQLDCGNCKNKCCNHLNIDDHAHIWDVINSLDMSCDNCKEKYCKEQ